MLINYFFIIATLFNSLTGANGTGDFPIINIQDLGAVGDGVTNDYWAYLQASKIINRAGGGTLIIPKGQYYINEYVSETNGIKHIKYKNLEKLKIIGNNATIMVKGDFHRAHTFSSSKNKYSQIVAVMPFAIFNSKNIEISNLEIDGNVDLMTKDSEVAESAGYLIRMVDCANVKLQNLYLHHAHSDGLNIVSRVKKGEENKSKNFYIRNVISKYNARQAFTIGGIENAKIENCEFSYTGYADGAYGGHAPGAGLDIEPMAKHYIVDNVIFENCTFHHNRGSEIVMSSSHNAKNIKFTNCTIDSGENSSLRWEVINNSGGALFDSCTFNLPHGSIYGTWAHKPTSLSILNSTIYSGDAGIMAINKKNKAELTLKNTTLYYTGSKKIKRYFPYIVMENVIMENCSIYIPKDKIRSKKLTGLIHNVKHIKNVQIYSDSIGFIPNISYKGSTIIK